MQHARYAQEYSVYSTVRSTPVVYSACLCWAIDGDAAAHAGHD